VGNVTLVAVPAVVTFHAEANGYCIITLFALETSLTTYIFVPSGLKSTDLKGSYCPLEWVNVWLVDPAEETLFTDQAPPQSYWYTRLLVVLVLIIEVVVK
tara:strand:+ start:2275 stop:2574 length:300 start_codon:yes stop_codon:yes gene_type:complete